MELEEDLQRYQPDPVLFELQVSEALETGKSVRFQLAYLVSGKIESLQILQRTEYATWQVAESVVAQVDQLQVGQVLKDSILYQLDHVVLQVELAGLVEVLDFVGVQFDMVRIALVVFEYGLVDMKDVVGLFGLVVVARVDMLEFFENEVVYLVNDELVFV